MAKLPTIKGIFVNSHIKALRSQKGEAGIKQLEEKFGRSVNFRNSENVPVSDEIKIVEYSLDILTNNTVPESMRAFEAGRLHFKNFMGTPYAKLIFAIFKDYKKILLRSKYVAEYVFDGIIFNPIDLGESCTKIIMEGGQYPLDHFKGFFYEWMILSGFAPHVEARKIDQEVYEYLLCWERHNIA